MGIAASGAAISLQVEQFQETAAVSRNRDIFREVLPPLLFKPPLAVQLADQKPGAA